jgi:glycosyltransferase involved in cell wall biosynthesis
VSTAPLVSFVLLSYNYARFIGETITSVLEQQGDHSFELIIVDDASTDNSHDVIAGFRDLRIRYFRHSRNLGHAATVTNGLRAARGRYVARIDSDDRYRPVFLNEVLPIFQRFPDVGLVHGDAALIDDDGVRTEERVDTQHGDRDFHGNEYVALLERNFVCAPTVIARREAWLTALPIPDALSFHDWYFTLNIARRWPFYFRSAVLADYRVHRTNYHTLITRNKSEEDSIMRLLAQLFAQVETDSALEQRKQRARSRIYAAHYMTLALKYFGAGMGADARRCYLEALRRRPAYLSRFVVMRQLFATVIGISRYQRLKSLLGRS